MVDAIDQEPGVQLAVVRVAFGRQLHKLRAPVLRVVDEFDEPLGRKLIRQPLHPLAAGGPHLGDLRHGQRTKQREASHEAERTAAPTGDEPGLLAEARILKKHWATSSISSAIASALLSTIGPPVLCARPVSCRRHRLRSL